MARLVRYGRRLCTSLSDWVLFPSLITRCSNIADDCCAFIQSDLAVGNPYLLTQSSTDHCQPVTNIYPRAAYRYPPYYAHGG